MNKNYLLLTFIVIGTLVFNFLFWQEKMGLNILLFDVLIFFMMFKLGPDDLRRRGPIITGLCTLLLAICIVFNNSNLSKIIHAISFTCFIGLVHIKELTFIGDAIVAGVVSLSEGPNKALKTLSMKTIGGENTNSLMNWAKLCLVPLLILIVFFSIYVGASPKFAFLVSEFWSRTFEMFVPSVSFAHLLFFGGGFFFVCGVLLPSLYFKNYSGTTYSETLDRAQIKRHRLNPSNRSHSLKSEYRTAWMVIASLNLLLFIVNLIDVRYVWFGSETVTPNELSNYVHEGTYLLIVAILLAMSVVVFYFRKNLNFYPNNRNLIWCTYIWIAQNLILAVSVAIRNMQYVEHYGLAHKRLGVFMFLMLVLVGLVSMYLKVKEKKSFYYLINRNVWAAYFAFVLVSIVNWDVIITKYNITAETHAKIDVQYLINDLSDKNIYLLIDHRSDLIRSLGNKAAYEAILNIKLSDFKIDQQEFSWCSWNYSDYRNQNKITALQ